MALGFNLDTSSASFLPIAKYDARAGRVFRRDRVGGENTDVDITKNFKAIFDMENIEIGYIDFNTGGAPSFVMNLLSDGMPAKPSDAHKQGVRYIAKLAKDCGGDIREMASSAKVFLQGINTLHNDYEEGVKANPGKLPVVALKETVGVTAGEGAKKSTNYRPVFEIVSWVNRPEDLVAQPRSAQPEAPKASAPPSTGSTKVSAPVKATEEPMDDFG